MLDIFYFSFQESEIKIIIPILQMEKVGDWSEVIKQGGGRAVVAAGSRSELY